MNTKQAFIIFAGVAVLALIALFLVNLFSISEQTIQYTYPAEGESTVYEISTVPENTVSEITDYGLSDEEKQAVFEKYRQEQDWAAEYQEARDTAESDTADSFVESEEARIEAYCDENGILGCADIKYTCGTEYECHLVTITCKDSEYDPAKEINWGKKYGCDEWDVTVAQDTFDIRNVDSSYWEGYGWQW